MTHDLIVVGGGVIGLEMACYFASVGVKVTVIEMMNKMTFSLFIHLCKFPFVEQT